MKIVDSVKYSIKAGQDEYWAVDYSMNNEWGYTWFCADSAEAKSPGINDYHEMLRLTRRSIVRRVNNGK